MKPGEEVALDVGALKIAARDPRTLPATRERAISALDRLCDPLAVLVGGAVERDYLVRIYRRRIKRKSEVTSFPAGTEEFVERLAGEATADPVVTFAIEREGAVLYLFTART